MKNKVAATDIHIVCAPVQSGKTSALQAWLGSPDSAAGVLTPDISGRRMLYDITTEYYRTLQIPETDSTDSTIKVGRFCFDEHAFEKAQQILLKGMQGNAEWLVG
jgi:hypothetical protein